MTMAPEELMALCFGGKSVAENLKTAFGSGKIVEKETGTIEVPVEPNNEWTIVPNGPALDCFFWMKVMFQGAYAQSAVPNGCRECYKVKVAPRTLRQLVAAWQVAKGVECLSKWGIDLNNPFSQDIYAGYFYTSGLEAARALFKVVRELFDADPKLGPDIKITIKRGCSEYENALGPSNQYQFTPELAELEAHLKAKYRPRKGATKQLAVLAEWIDLAFRMGDDTYLDFTGGKPLRRSTLAYDP